MDVITLSLAKKYANKVAAGFSNVEVQGNNLIFTLNDGTTATMTIPAPADGKDGADGAAGKDGLSVQNLSIDDDGSLLCHMSDGSVIDAGKVPTIETEQIQSDWSQNDETQPDYIKNRIGGYEAYKEIPVFENKTVTLTKAYPEILDNYIYNYSLTDEEFNLYQQNFPYSEMTGKLVYGGKEYIQTGVFDVETFTCQIRYNTDTCEVCIPNLHYIWVEFYDAESVNTEFTFSLYKMESGIVTIPEKYLPDTVATKEYVDEKSEIPLITSKEDLTELINKTKYLRGGNYYSDAIFRYNKDGDSSYTYLMSLLNVNLSSLNNTSINGYSTISKIGNTIHCRPANMTITGSLVDDVITITYINSFYSSLETIDNSTEVNNKINNAINNALGDVNTILATLTTVEEEE